MASKDAFDWNEDDDFAAGIVAPLRDLSVVDRESAERPPNTVRDRRQDETIAIGAWYNGQSPEEYLQDNEDTLRGWIPPEGCSGVDLEQEKSYVDEHKEEMEKVILEISMRDLNAANNPGPSGNGNRQPCRPVSYVSDLSLAGTKVPDERGRPGNPHELDHIYNAFDMSTKGSGHKQLAVYAYKNQIIEGLQKHQVMIVEGFTGSGKTTQIPQYILEDLASKSKLGNIVVTQPRRIAAQSVAERVCGEREWRIGDLVGYQVGLNRKTSESTRLTYMTTGVLLQTLISKKQLHDYSHIIVDEVHERDLDTDLLILVIKKLMVQTAERTTKIILMSATLNAEKFADYFPKWGMPGRKQESVIIKIRAPNTSHRVHEFYVDNIERALGDGLSYISSEAANDISDEPKLHNSMYSLTAKMFEALDQFEQNIAQKQGKQIPRGGVLAFLPGLMEIDTMYKKCMEFLDHEYEENKKDLCWTLIPLHSTITTEEQQKVFLPTRQGFRKIILATNIAESSITVTDITYVIDFCLTKSISCDPQTNYSCLRMEWASQDQCVQRRGRVGRVSEGYVFRMIPKKYFQQLGKETIPDMEKACLENVILSVKTLDLGPPKSIMAIAIDPPAVSAIRLAISNLKEVGALAIGVNGVFSAFDGDLTMMGMLMSKLPFDIRYSRLIALGHIFGVLEETVIMACGLSVKSAFSFPFTRRLMAYMSKLLWSNETFSDCFAIVNLYRTWMCKLGNGELAHNYQMRAWKKSYFVQQNVLKDMHVCIDDIIRRLRNVGIMVDKDRLEHGAMNAEQALMLKISMCGAFYPNYFIRHRPETVDYARQITRELNSCNPFDTLVYNGFPQEQPGDLYAQHIAQKFESLNSVPYVKISGSKVLVQFDARGLKVGPLSLNLFRGVKMRQLRNQIQFRTLRSDVSRELLKEEMEYTKERIRVLSPPLCELPGITVKYVKVSVTKVISPDSFYVLYFKFLPELFELLRKILSNINTCKWMEASDLIPGTLCLTKHDDQYFRARVEYIKTDGDSAMLFLIDLGETVWRRPEECLSISDEMMKLGVHTKPAYSIQCRIGGIKPPARYSGAWGDDVAAAMANQLSWNNNIVVMEIFSVVDNVVSCDIFGRCDENGVGNDVGTRAMLIKLGMVAESEDPGANRDNQNLRRNVRLIRFKDEEIDRHNAAQRREESHPILLKPPASYNCTHDYTLKGPFSPLEMSFRALSSSAHTKAVTIEQCSVNSVALDQDPTSSTSRLLIAAGVGISQRSGSVIARETTLMPPVPGLTALMTMIFCPMMQLRAESKTNRYTGCLSGLGKDFITKQAVYPDHDMEVVFDVHFDKSDIRFINRIREIMNEVLNLAKYDKMTTEIETLRAEAAEHIKVLLERNRAAVEEIYPKDEFVWKISEKRPTNSQLLVNGEVDNMGIPIHRIDVFPLHSTEPVAAAQQRFRDNVFP